jgi:hypothetical protein
MRPVRVVAAPVEHRPTIPAAAAKAPARYRAPDRVRSDRLLPASFRRHGDMAGLVTWLARSRLPRFAHPMNSIASGRLAGVNRRMSRLRGARLFFTNGLTQFQTTLVAHDPVLKGHWPSNIVGFRLMCEYKKRTTLIVPPMATGIAFHLGVLGMHVGSIFCPGDISKLTPADGEAFILGPGVMERVSLKAFVERFQSFAEQGSSKPATVQFRNGRGRRHRAGRA